MKTWEKPILVILTRSGAEAVLSFCKGYVDVAAMAVDGGPNSFDSSCMLQPTKEATCAFCQQSNAS